MSRQSGQYQQILAGHDIDWPSAAGQMYHYGRQQATGDPRNMSCYVPFDQLQYNAQMAGLIGFPSLVQQHEPATDETLKQLYTLQQFPNGGLAANAGEQDTDELQTTASGNDTKALSEKPKLRDPQKAPRGCPDGHWWCKSCSKYLYLELFNPKTKAMQYKYLCAGCESKTKIIQAEKFKRRHDGQVNPNHPRRVGAQNRVVDQDGNTSAKTDGPAGSTNEELQNPKKRGRRGRQWSSVEKMVAQFHSDVDWKLLVFGIRNRDVHLATNFGEGKDFAAPALRTRYRSYALGEEPSPGGGSTASPPTTSAGVPPAKTKDELLQQIQAISAKQRSVSHQLDDCFSTVLGMLSAKPRRPPNLLAQQPLAMGPLYATSWAPTDTSATVYSAVNKPASKSPIQGPVAAEDQI